MKNWKNWRTTLMGVAAGMTWLGQQIGEALANGTPIHWGTMVASVLLIVFGVVAKDAKEAVKTQATLLCLFFIVGSSVTACSVLKPPTVANNQVCETAVYEGRTLQLCVKQSDLERLREMASRKIPLQLETDAGS